MTPPQFTVAMRSASDTAAEIELLDADGQLATSWSGLLHGPRCLYTRTVPNEFRITSGRAVLPEPCYWSPPLPFLYEMTLRGKDAGGVDREVKQRIGLRRLTIRRQSLYWDSRRVVLRGLRAAALTAGLADESHEAEATLILPNPSESQCELGDWTGVAIIADLRGTASTLEEFRRLASHPSISIVLMEAQQSIPGHDQQQLPSGTILAAVVSFPVVETLPAWTKVVAVEFGLEERPPPWLATCGKPVIAIRRAGAYADIHAARAASDRLQAELAPKFNLAGYFVGA